MILTAIGAGLWLALRRGNDSLTLILLILILLTPSLIDIAGQRRAVAQLPCPKCSKPFGWTTSWHRASPIEFYCQHCGLSMLDGE